MVQRVDINADILTWAVNRAGYELSEFAEKVPNIFDWIEGDKKPTFKQLEKFSKKVHIPFGYLFLSEPPEEKLPIPYFRSNGNQKEKVNINVYDTIILLQQRQDWLRNYLTDNDFEPIPFVGKFNQNLQTEAIVQDIRNQLGLDENWASHHKTWEEALNHLVEIIEDNGIIVVFNGVVENNTSRPIDVNECRGFVLVDEIAPFMFINNADAKSAQMFTIVHELAHIWTGHSAGFDYRKLLPADNPIEILCDKVAAEFLVPQNTFFDIWNRSQDLKEASRYFKVSEIVIARRALDLGQVTKPEFFAFYEKNKNREFIKKEKRSAGGDFYATTKKRLSITFASHINQAVNSGKLLYRDAYKLTSLKGDTFENFFKDHI